MFKKSLYSSVLEYVKNKYGLNDIEADEYINNNEEEYYKIVKIILKQIGDKEYDYIYVVDEGRLDLGEKITDYENLYEYYKTWTLYQRKYNLISYQSMIDNIKSEKENILSFIRNANHFLNEKVTNRKLYLEKNILNDIDDIFYLIKGDNLYRFDNYDLRFYLFEDAEYFIDAEIEKLIPHRIKDDNVNNFLKNINNENYLMYDANGKENELLFLMEITNNYIYNGGLKQDMERILNKYEDQIKNSVILIKEKDGIKSRIKYFALYSDIDAIKNIKIKNFYDDIMKIKKSGKIYDKISNELFLVIDERLRRYFNEVKKYFE